VGRGRNSKRRRKNQHVQLFKTECSKIWQCGQCGRKRVQKRTEKVLVHVNVHHAENSRSVEFSPVSCVTEPKDYLNILKGEAICNLPRMTLKTVLLANSYAV
jgi:hypothetical protein